MSLIEKKSYVQKWFSSDEQFNKLYPSSVRSIASKHWTPLNVARKVAIFLADDDNVKILDIGSGAGKFCLAGAHYKPKAFYYGVEQRKNLIVHAETAREKLRIENASFIHANFTQLDFKSFDHFYFFNSFYENLAGTEKIDDSIDYSSELYNYYSHYLYRQLEEKPKGTKLATFHSLEDEIPKSYRELNSEFNNLLKFWIKT